MSHWNHRVIKHFDKRTGETWYGIHEVFYDDQVGTVSDTGKMGWTQDPIGVVGDDIESLRWTLEHMLACLDKPMIEDNDDDATA